MSQLKWIRVYIIKMMIASLCIAAASVAAAVVRNEVNVFGRMRSLNSQKNATNEGHASKKSRFIHHKVPILSSNMVLHKYEYKPRGFSLIARRITDKRVLVEFNYTVHDIYNKYILRMRYHNHAEEYATNKTLLDRHEPNQIILNDFPHSAYIVCITLLPSMQAAYSAPLSTSDMCVDVTFGEVHRVNEHHINRTGLLAPVLFVLVLIELLYVTFAYKARHSKCCGGGGGGSTKAGEKSSTDKAAAGRQVHPSVNHLAFYNRYFDDYSKLANILLYYDNGEIFEADTSADNCHYHENSGSSSSTNSRKSTPELHYYNDTRPTLTNRKANNNNNNSNTRNNDYYANKLFQQHYI